MLRRVCHRFQPVVGMEFLIDVAKELDYRLIKELWAFTGDRIPVLHGPFAYPGRVGSRFFENWRERRDSNPRPPA